MDNRARSFPDLDLTPLFGSGHYAVHVKTPEEAEHFLDYMFRAHPDKCGGWTRGETHFGKYHEMCFRPNLNKPSGWLMKYCSLSFYQQEHFTIIPFEDLLVQAEMEESDMPIESLFGWN